MNPEFSRLFLTNQIVFDKNTIIIKPEKNCQNCSNWSKNRENVIIIIIYFNYNLIEYHFYQHCSVQSVINNYGIDS